MKTGRNLLRTLLLASIAFGLGLPSNLAVAAADPAPAEAARTHSAIPWSQLGAKAGVDYHGDGLAVNPTEQGARLRCVFQRLEGQATREGLWLTSTVTNAVSDRFRIVAAEVGRVRTFGVRRQSGAAIPPFKNERRRAAVAAFEGGVALRFPLTSQALACTGTVEVVDTRVRFVRPGLVEEYSVSMDGLRQDFIVLEKPVLPLNSLKSDRDSQSGELRVALKVTGADVEPAAYGARLVLPKSGRKIAYSRLRAIDATGRELPARMEVVGGAAAPTALVRTGAEQERWGVCALVLLLVDDNEAVYPVRIDPTFSDANWISMGSGMTGVDGIVWAAAMDSSGNLYIGGCFTVAGDTIANNIAKWDGSRWSALGSGINGVGYPDFGPGVEVLAVSGNDLYAGGHFTTAGGIAANCIARWDGNHWSALDSGMNGGDQYGPAVVALVVVGRDLYAGGDFSTAGGIAAKNIAKWDGSRWSALGSGILGMNGARVSALAVSGNDLYAGGRFTTAGGIAATNIAKWDGSQWSALGYGVGGGDYYGEVSALAVSGADLYMGGWFTTAGGIAATNIAKWDGIQWSALGSGMDSWVSALAVSGSDLYAGGNFRTAGGVAANCIAKWDGSHWSTLGWGMLWINVGVCALAVSGNDLYAGGNFTTAGGVAANSIAKWDGSRWSGLGSGINGGDPKYGPAVVALAVAGSDLYVGGEFSTVGGVAATNIAKWDGSRWSTLGSGMNGVGYPDFGPGVFALAVSGNDLYAGGRFTTAGGIAATNVAKWDGSRWSALGSGMNDWVGALAVSGGDLYAGGYFTTAGGIAANSIAKWDGSRWSALGSGMGGDPQYGPAVVALAVAGSDLYAGGEFSTVGGVAATNIAKWDGIQWSALGSGISGMNGAAVRALALSGSELYAGGYFTTAGGIAANSVAKWDGSRWSALGSGMGVSVSVDALAASGSDVYAGGDFTTAGGVAANYIARWDGIQWSALGSGVKGSGVNRSVKALAVSGSHLYALGYFSMAGGKVSAYVAGAVISPTAPPVLLSNVAASQRASIGLIDLFYDLSGGGSGYSVAVAVSSDGGASFNVPATHLVGDGVSNPAAPGTGRHIVWDAGADLGQGYFPNVAVRISASGSSAISSVFPVNLRGLAGGLALSGQVLDGGTGLAVAGALAQLGASSATTDSQGRFSFPSVAVGDYTLSVSKAGYTTASIAVSVTPGSAPSRVITLYPAASAGSPPRVTSVTSKYPDTACYLDGVPFGVAFTATVDWAGHPPGTVQFLTPRKTYTVTVGGSAASQTLAMGSDFGPNGRLRVAVVSSDGTRSAEFLAKLVVAPNPLAFLVVPSWGLEDQGNGFSYNTSFDTTIFDQGVEDGIIPKSIPVFGDKALKVEFIPAIEAAVNSDGTATVAIKWDNMDAGSLLEAERKNHGLRSLMNLLSDLVDKGVIDKRHLPHSPFGGLDLTLYPELGGGWKYSADAGAWQWNDAFAGLGADLSVSQTWPFLIGFVPMYAKVKAELTVDATAHLLQLSPLSLAGEVDVNPSLRGSLGVGISELLAAEGWVEGGAKVDMQWPEPPSGQSASLYIKAGATIYYLIGHQDYSGLLWSWPEGAPVQGKYLVLRQQAPWQPLSRDYLQHPSRGILAPPARTRLKDDGGGSVAILLSPVFPYSDPNCAASGTNLYLTFLTDNTNRTTMNRTMAMFTKFNGTNWSQPAAIADDGTADFHPRLLSFPDGSAGAAWENEGAVLPDSATLDTMKSNLEVSVAWFNPATGAWSPAVQMSANHFLDRSPKLAGRTKDNVLLTWIANPANDENGGPAAPNQLWSARWNGSVWSTPLLAATVSNALVKYDLAYDGATANLVLSVDTVPGSTNVNGHELFRVAYQAGAWGPLTPLTSDQVPDDNPQLTLDAQGNVVLTWLKGAELSSVVNFAMSNRQVLRTNEYSSNLADFTLAASGGGKRALLWAEPSENSSDLFGMFYDPAAQVWGAPKQLTHDPQTERGTSAAFLGEGRLVAVYDRTLISSTNAPGTSPTDLAALVYPLGEDLALDGNLIYSVPANPSPGGTATLHVKVLNLGDQVETNVVVAFYRDAVQATSELGRVALTNALPPQGTNEVIFTWSVPATNSPLAVFAVIDPDQRVSDVSRSNNVVRLDLVKPNLAIQSMSWSRVTSNLLAVTVRAGNDGAISNGPVTLSLRQDSVTGTNLFSQAVSGLLPGESVEVSFLWNVTGLPNNLNVFAVLSGAGISNNFSGASLTRQLTINQVTPPWLGDGQYLPNGSFQLTIYGDAGRTYSVQASTNLVNWVPIQQFINTNGTMTVVDPAATNFSYRFYRAVTP